MSTALGTVLTGPSVADCWRATLVAYGSVHYLTTGDMRITTDAMFGTNPTVHQIQTNGTEFILLDGVSYMRKPGAAWVIGKLPGTVDEMLAANVGKGLGGTMSPTGLTLGMSTCPEWKVVKKQVVVTMAEGGVVPDAIELHCTSTTALRQDAKQWILNDWTPVANSDTSTAYGQTLSLRNELTQLGVKVLLQPPTARS